MVKGYWADVSQSVGRFPFGGLGTFCRSSIKYSYELDCVLTGADALGALGFSHQDVRDARNKFSDADVQDLCGEAFSMPCIAMCMYLYYLNPHAPWWAPPEEQLSPHRIP